MSALRLSIGLCFLLGLFDSTTAVRAQQSGALRVGVAPFENSTPFDQELFITTLSGQKQRGYSVEFVPLEAIKYEDALNEARQAQCEFALFQKGLSEPGL